MEQTTVNRGHIAFLQDQVNAAAAAFAAGEVAEVTPILESVAGYIEKFLAEANGKRQ